MQIIALRKGGAKCSSACPFYEETGVVRGFYGMPLETHCRMTMSPWMVDCDEYDPLCIDKMEVSEAQWKKMQKAAGEKAVRVRKEYPEDHEEIHGVGCEWTRASAGEWTKASAGEWTRGKGRYNAEKSGKANPRRLYPCRVKSHLDI